MLRQLTSKIDRDNSGRRMHSLLTYSLTTIVLTLFAAILFKAMQLEAEFAIAVTGSLIGGFLGAMLAMILMVDLQERLGGRKDE